MTTTIDLDTLPWVYDDGGRAAAGFKGDVGDCVTRAIAIATGTPYATVVDLVNAMGTERGRRMYKTKAAGLLGDDVTDLLASRFGWTYTELGRGVHLAPGELPDEPRMIARLSAKHLCAVVDGAIRDTWDSSRMRSQKPDAKRHNRHLVKGIYLPPAEIVAPGPSEGVTSVPDERPAATVAVETPPVVHTATPTTSYRDAAIALWGQAGAYAHDAYQRWLPLFPDLPDTLPIVIGITAYGRCIGLTRPGWEHGPRITIASNLFTTARRAVDDVMVHEMLHAWLYLTGQAAAHDSEAWYAEIRRLSPQVLGHDLDVHRGAHRKSVRVKLDDGTSTVRKIKVPEHEGQHDRVSRWPSPFRPKDYDWGEPIPCPSY